MDITKLKDKQILKLSKDIKNPKPDGRVTRDWRGAKTFAAGLRLVVRVEERKTSIPCGVEDVTYKIITLTSRGLGLTLTPHNDEKRVSPIVRASEVVAPTATEILAAERMDFPSEVLDFLMSSGMLSAEALRMALIALDKKWEAEGEYA